MRTAFRTHARTETSEKLATRYDAAIRVDVPGVQVATDEEANVLGSALIVDLYDDQAGFPGLVFFADHRWRFGGRLGSFNPDDPDLSSTGRSDPASIDRTSRSKTPSLQPSIWDCSTSTSRSALVPSG